MDVCVCVCVCVVNFIHVTIGVYLQILLKELPMLFMWKYSTLNCEKYFEFSNSLINIMP